MINTLHRIYHDHKYKVGVFVLLAAASAICVALEIVRIMYSQTTAYTNLVWNLFLAWIPFILAYLAYMLSWRKPLIYVVLPIFAFLWLIFFPNAPYILTDFQHLGYGSAGAPLWFDVVILIWYSWTGLLLGIVSLNLMQEIIKREIGRLAGWIFVFIASCLTSVGLYLGRFGRLNSWDIFHPLNFASSLPDSITDPTLRSVGFIVLYTLFFIFVYLTIYAFGHILHEGPDNRGTGNP